MNKQINSIIDQEWPAEELEEVVACPYCNGSERSLGYKDVQDWSFYCAPGKWSYWNCINCEALYLNPRPKQEFIYKSYANYYTHGKEVTSLMDRFKEKLRNECYSRWLTINITPRLNIPRWCSFVLKVFKSKIQMPFGLEYLVNMPKGHLLDFGCGSGRTLSMAKQLGWKVTGIEIDEKAVAKAKSLGLNIIQGDFQKLSEMIEQFDCVMCSHVLEHVNQPLELLKLLANTLRPQGIMFVSLPNSKSSVLQYYGDNWRGLEAPRHISIPSLENLSSKLESMGFKIIEQINTYDATVKLSEKIYKNRKKSSSKYSALNANIKDKKNSDFIQIICQKLH